MKKICIVIFLFINLFAFNKNDEIIVKPLVFVNTDILNISKEADENSSIIGFYTNGEAIEVLSEHNGWIQTPDGYVSSKLVFSIKSNLNLDKKRVLRVEVNKLFLMETPSVIGDIKGFLTKGQYIYSLGQKGNWTHTPYGYVYSKYLSLKDKKTVKDQIKMLTEEPKLDTKPSTNLQDPIIEFSQQAYMQLEKMKIKKIKFNFETYLSKLLQSSKEYDNSYLNYKLAKLQNLISQDKYNFNFHFQTALGYSRSIPNTGGFTDTSTLNSDLVLSKKLYDGQKSYTYNKKAFLVQRLSELEHLKTKEQVTLLGLDIYTNLLLIQEQIKIQKKVQKYKKSLLNNLDKRSKVLKIVDLDKLAIQNEILDLEKSLINLTQMYKTSNHLFRQSIDLSADGKIILGWFDISQSISNLYNLKKMAMAKNNDVAVSQNQLKLSQADIIMQHSRKDWEINFNTALGIQTQKVKTSTTVTNTHGTAWNTALTFKYPIYQGNDINLNVQRAKIETLKAKNLLNIQQKSILNLIEQKYNEYEQNSKLDTILKKQSKILTRTKEAYKKRYLLGAGPYREFSDEISKHLTNENDSLINSINIRKNFIELSILTGKKIFGK